MNSLVFLIWAEGTIENGILEWNSDHLGEGKGLEGYG